MFRLSRTSLKEWDPLVGSQIDINITFFVFLPGNCRVLGVHEEKTEEEGKERRGGGGRVLDISDGQSAEVSLEGNLCSSRSNFVDHFA